MVSTMFFKSNSMEAGKGDSKSEQVTSTTCEFWTEPAMKGGQQKRLTFLTWRCLMRSTCALLLLFRQTSDGMTLF
jgi:hypothetical protein